MSFLKTEKLTLQKVSILSLSLFLITIGSIGILKHTAQSQDDTVCTVDAISCTINPGETVIIEIPQSWIDTETGAQSWKVKNTGNLPAIFVPKNTIEEYISFLSHFPGLQLIEDADDPDPIDEGLIRRPPIFSQSTPTISGCPSTVWGTNCTVTASGGESSGDYVFDYVSGPCSINSSSGVVASTAAGTCVVRVMKLGDSSYDDSPYSSNYSITLNKQDCSHPCGSGTVNHGSSVTCFQYSSVQCGTCPSQPRTCNNGVMSGTYTNQSCSPGSCPSTTSWACGATACKEQRSTYSCSNNVCVETIEYRNADHCGGCSGGEICDTGSCVTDICGQYGVITHNGLDYLAIQKKGVCWLDRNLGATRACTAINDSACYGDLFQWGRLADGHQAKNSLTTTNLSSTDNPGTNRFITSLDSPQDWRAPQNKNLWQGATGVNNPCPSGWRLPTRNELNAERSSWSSNNSAGAYASSLNWSVAGFRHPNGNLSSVGSRGFVWSSTDNMTASSRLRFVNTGAEMYHRGRAKACSLRCLRD